MNTNAFILDWTMDDYAGLKDKLRGAGFDFERDGASEHIRVVVPFERVDAFADVCRPHLNAPCNYIDVQFPAQRQTVLIFREQVFFVTNAEANARVTQWALDRGLPPHQADWPRSYEST